LASTYKELPDTVFLVKDYTAVL